MIFYQHFSLLEQTSRESYLDLSLALEKYNKSNFIIAWLFVNFRMRERESHW